MKTENLMTIRVSEIRPDDSRPAGWWESEDGRGLLDMTGLTLAQAAREMLGQCGTVDGARENFLSGSLQILNPPT
jgi:hypothetical protein